jgi:selenide,water dikinase
VNACTDVTGFGLIGHACEMIDDSSTGLRLFKDEIPVISEAVDFAGMGIVPAGGTRNRKYRENQVTGIEKIDPVLLDILFDPQTSGGLLVALEHDEAEDYVSRLKAKGMEDVAIIGEFIKECKGKVII